MKGRPLIPKRIARYIAVKFLKGLILTILALTAIYLLVEFFERVDNLMAQGLPFSVMIEYLSMKTPQVIFQILPVAILLTTLFVLGGMAKDNEIIAMMAGGISLFEIIIPLIIIFILLGLLSGIYGEYWSPHLAEETHFRLSQIKGVRPAHKLSEGKVWLAGEEGRFFHIKYIDFPNESLKGVTIFEVDERFQLRKRWDIRECYYRNGVWELFDCEAWEFHDDRPRLEKLEKTRIIWPETFSDFASLQKNPQEMSFLELRDYLRRLEKWGYKTYMLRTDLHFKIAFPFACLIFGLLGIPFALHLNRGVRYMSIGISMIASFIYWIIMHLGVSMAHAGILPPLLGAWAGNLIFGILLFISIHYMRG